MKTKMKQSKKYRILDEGSLELKSGDPLDDMTFFISLLAMSISRQFDNEEFMKSLFEELKGKSEITDDYKYKFIQQNIILKTCLHLTDLYALNIGKPFIDKMKELSDKADAKDAFREVH